MNGHVLKYHLLKFSSLRDLLKEKGYSFDRLEVQKELGDKTRWPALERCEL